LDLKQSLDNYGGFLKTPLIPSKEKARSTLFSFDVDRENGNSKKGQKRRQGISGCCSGFIFQKDTICGDHLLSDFSACFVPLDWSLELACNLASGDKCFHASRYVDC
jgi:hypothetical protein